MDEQPLLVGLEAPPAEVDPPVHEPGESQKLVFGQRRRKALAEPPGGPLENLKLKAVNRDQLLMRTVDLEQLLEADHPARAIWELLGRLDLSGFCAHIRSQQGEKGRAANSPQLLASVWLYAYSRGISSAREIERQMAYEPGLMWLCGAVSINHHTLSDFRVGHQEALDALFRDVLAVLDQDGLIDLSRVMHDGTKIRAQAGVDTFRREKTIQERLEEAQKILARMGDPREDQPAQNARQRAARERAGRECVARLEASLAEWDKIRSGQTAKEAEQARVSVVEPEARKMKHGDNAIVPSYNMQVSTESKNKVIVGMHLSQCSADAPSLMRAVEVVEENTGRRPEKLVVDGGFTSKQNIIESGKRGIELIGSLPDLDKKRAAGAVAAGIDAAFGVEFFILQPDGKTLQCPAGKQLTPVGNSTKRGNRYKVYQAAAADCQACAYQKKCCVRTTHGGRKVAKMVAEDPSVAEFRSKMESEEAKRIYKQRGEVAEFPNAWIKEKIGLRKYRLRGLLKAGIESVWACLAYNVAQWIRLVWRSQQAAA